MEDYKPNSYKSREEQKQQQVIEKRAQKIVTGGVKTKKKSGLQKFADGFLYDDISKLKDYAIKDVLIPSAKRMIDEIISNGIHMILYGDSGRGSSSLPANRVIYGGTNYNGISTNRANNRVDASRSTFSYDSVSFQSRGDAEAVLRGMDEIVDQYGYVKVSDLYDLAGITEFNYTSNNYGWTDITSARIVSTRDGYGWTIKLPRALPLD